MPGSKWRAALRRRRGRRFVLRSIEIAGFLLAAGMYTGCFAQAKPGKDRMLSPHERFLAIQAEYRGAVASGDSAQIAEKSYLMGKRYHDFGDYYEARKWFFKALKLREKNTASIHLAKIYGGLGNCAVREGNWDDGMKFRQISLGYSLKSDNQDRNIKTGCFLEAGMVHLDAWKEKQRGRYSSAFVPSLDSAFWYYRQSRRFADEEKNEIMLAVVTRFAGQVLCEMGRLEAGVDSLEKALDVLAAQGRRETFNVASTAALIGEAYLKNKRLSEAGFWLHKANAITDTASVRAYMEFANTRKKLSDYYAEVGDWRRAYQLSQEAHSVSAKELEFYRKGSRESIDLIHENELKVAEIEAGRRELELQREKAKVRAQLYQLVGGAMVIAILAGVVFYRLYRKYKLVSIENARLVKEQSHRVKNNLQSVYDLLSLQLGRLSEPAAVEALTESLSRVEAVTRVHQRLYQGGRLAEVELTAYVPDLVGGVLRSYSKEYVDQSFDLSGVWLHADEVVPVGLVISELVTNSCKYAFDNHNSPALEIRCRCDPDGIVYFRYADNGPGFAADAAKQSFGLKLVELLARQLKGEFSFSGERGSVFELSFKTRQHGTIRSAN